MGKVTELDREIALKIRALRDKSGLTQPQVASHLGIAYQSYQKMEKGRVSFRASTLSILANLYGIRPGQLIDGENVVADPGLAKIVLVAFSLPKEMQEKAVSALLKIKHRVPV